MKVSYKETVIVETKGIEDPDVPLKMERLKRWCKYVNQVQTGVNYDYVFVDEEGFKKHTPKTFRDLLNTFRGYR